MTRASFTPTTFHINKLAFTIRRTMQVISRMLPYSSSQAKSVVAAATPCVNDSSYRTLLRRINLRELLIHRKVRSRR
jgi:hypothetical protein